MSEESMELLQAQIQLLEERVKALEEACKPESMSAAVQKRLGRLGV